MATESFLVTALPHSVAADADVHVAVFIAPEIVPDAPGQLLGSMALFPKWASALVADGTIDLSNQDGSIECTPLLDRVQPGEWEAVFPPKTPIENKRGPDLADRRWRTFRPAYLHDAGKLLHAAAMFADPTSPPLPSKHPLAPPLVSYLRQHEVFGRGLGSYDESRVTELHDRAIGELGDSRRLDALERQLDAMSGLDRFFLELHRARRFYERPESARAYRDRPDPDATMPKLAPPTLDFHQRVAIAGDHPALLRRLGLVVELKVADLARLRTSQWLSAKVTVGGVTGTPTRVRCEAFGDALVTVAETADWLHGRLRIGDADRYSVLDIDADGTALKLDRFIWSIPRLLQVEANGDPIHAAPTALRATGFTVARSGRAQSSIARQNAQTQLRAELAAGRPPLLSTEDVTRGIRVEVWDATERRWSSLHARLIDLEVFGLGELLTKQPEDGFIQGTAATESGGVVDGPIHVHEAMFGWDGWSLAAPKPGLRVRHVAPPDAPIGPDGEPETEVVEPVTETPVAERPVVVVNHVAPGTLPWLRYGRSYAFRVWAVDLAGNARPHALGRAADPTPAFTSSVASMLADVRPRALGPHLVQQVRATLVAGLVDAPPPDDVATNAGGLPSLVGDIETDRLVLGRLVERRANRARSLGDAGRASIVGRVFRSVVADQAVAMIDDTRILDATAVSDLLAGAGLADLPGPQLLVEADCVSALKPFLRWDPIAPPAVVTKQKFSPGESLRHLVIRSGVAQDPVTLAITLTPPDAYADANPGFSYAGVSSRHVAPPKTSQVEAELFGQFDDAIGSSDPAVHRAHAAVAVRESGTFFDLTVPSLADPSVPLPQPLVSLEQDAAVQPVEPKALPLALGEVPSPGQYVVHGADELRLPYLPDVPARGVSLVFQDAGRDRSIGYPFGVESFTARYPGAWPERQPFRLDLTPAAELSGRLDGRVLTIALPPGDQQRFRLSSALDRADLDMFGLWRSLPASIRDDADIAEAAADGWLWAFTPFDDVTLVHAVPRPIEAPRPTIFRPAPRPAGSVEVAFIGAVDVHGPSTDSLTLEARWTDTVDDLTLPGPEDRDERGVAFTTPIVPFEDLALLAGADAQIDLPSVGPVRFHRAVHRFGDTRHRDVRYRFRASTRFREYFDPTTLAPVPADPSLPADPDRAEDDGRSVVGPLRVLDIPSSARPATPVVHSVVPLFLWDEGTEPEQPLAVRRRRRGGVRIYLERPWYSSGAGELLAVLLAPAGIDNDAMTWVSQWGADPVWFGAPATKRAMFLELPDLLHAVGLDDRPGDAIPVVPQVTLPLAALPNEPQVTVLGYRPQYSAARQLWYVDIAIDPRDVFWPFVRLAIARYQPSSIPGCHLSVPIRCDFTQVTPDRTASVSRIDDRHVRVVVSGPVGARSKPQSIDLGNATITENLAGFADRISAHRTVIAQLQQRDPAIPTDLGWKTVHTRVLPILGHGRTANEAAWVGVLDAPVSIPVVRPGSNEDWRVTIEEWERLPGDPATLALQGGGPPVWERRLIYADEIAL